MLINYHLSGHKSVANHSLKNKVQKSNLNISGLSSTPSIKEQLMRNTNRPRKLQGVPREEDHRTEKTLPFSINKLRQTFSSHPSERFFCLYSHVIFLEISFFMTMREEISHVSKKMLGFVFLQKKMKNTAGIQILKTIDQINFILYEAYVVLSSSTFLLTK